MGQYGSSPRVRGTRPTRPVRSRCSRIIPACAGNAEFPEDSPPLAPDHPRVCGERSSSGGRRSAPSGSSPRVRGTRADVAVAGLQARIIPACAGNAAPFARAPEGVPDHPRVCGEREPRTGTGESDAGSSPRVRGTRRRRRGERSGSRIIPACAGNARGVGVPACASTDHPRVCGERDPTMLNSYEFRGSSPRVRGTRGAARPSDVRGRIIPACAGKATRIDESRRRAPDHPRVCGERLPWRCWIDRKSGSSPRVRGTLHWHARDGRARRIIPACAGNARRTA